MKTVLAVAILTVACFAQNRFTDGGKTFSQDGNNIIERCTAPKPPQGAALNVQTAFYQETTLCAGYVQGVADLLSDTSVSIRPEVSPHPRLNPKYPESTLRLHRFVHAAIWRGCS
jgi:hypothetical protein